MDARPRVGGASTRELPAPSGAWDLPTLGTRGITSRAHGSCARGIISLAGVELETPPPPGACARVTGGALGIDYVYPIWDRLIRQR